MKENYGHKRNASESAEIGKINQFVHRRAVSNCIDQGVKGKYQENEKGKRKLEEFVGLLDAAETYFNEEMIFPFEYPICELDVLARNYEIINEENEKTLEKTKKLEASYIKLCAKSRENQRIQKELEEKISSLIQEFAESNSGNEREKPYVKDLLSKDDKTVRTSSNKNKLFVSDMKLRKN